LTIPAAGVFGSSVTVQPGMLFSSNLQLSGQAIFTGGTIVNSGGSVVGSTTTSPLPTPAYQIPTTSDVNYFGVEGSGQYTMPNGAIGAPQPVGSTLTAAPLANLATNPGQVFYAIGDTQVSGGFTLNGTLIVRGGQLIVGGAGFTITPQSGMPALICDQGIELQTGTNVPEPASNISLLVWGATTLSTSTSSSSSGTLNLPTLQGLTPLGGL